MPASNVSRGIHVFRPSHKRDFRIPFSHSCLYCNGWFHAKTSKAQYCPPCRPKRNVARATSHDTPEKKARRQARRRARKTHAGAELFSYTDVFNNTGGWCHICDVSIDMELRGPHPLSRSFDHVTPLSKGGEHVLANVKLAHLICNIKKGDRT